VGSVGVGGGADDVVVGVGAVAKVTARDALNPSPRTSRTGGP